MAIRGRSRMGKRQGFERPKRLFRPFHNGSLRLFQNGNLGSFQNGNLRSFQIDNLRPFQNGKKGKVLNG